MNELKIFPRRIAKTRVLRLAAREKTRPETSVGMCFLVVKLNNDIQLAFQRKLLRPHKEGIFHFQAISEE